MAVAISCVGEECSAIPERGPCKGSCPRYHFDPSDYKCKQFTYGCCGGNSNSYLTQQACLNACNDGRFTFYCKRSLFSCCTRIIISCYTILRYCYLTIFSYCKHTFLATTDVIYLANVNVKHVWYLTNIITLHYNILKQINVDLIQQNSFHCACKEY